MAMTRTERAVSCRTLSSLLQAIEGERTVVELRNDATLIGEVNHVDCNSNIDMSGVIYRSRYGIERQYEKIFVSGKHLRYVHIPDHVDMVKALQNQLNSLSGVKQLTSQESRNQQRKAEQKLKRQQNFEKQKAIFEAKLKTQTS